MNLADRNKQALQRQREIIQRLKLNVEETKKLLEKYSSNNKL